MTSPSTYSIWLRNSNNVVIDYVDNAKLVSMHMARNVYGDGALDMVLTAQTKWAALGQDARVEVWRTSMGGVTSLLTDTQWLITSYSKNVDSVGGKTYHLTAEPFVSLCSRRIVAYAAAAAQASKTDHADDMMKAIMRENYGSLATDTTRDMSSYLTIADDTSAAPSITLAFSWRNVKDVLLDIASASAADETTPTRLYFDMPYDTTTQKPVFTTYVGQPGDDHTRDAAEPVVFSYMRDNTANAQLLYDYTSEKNYVYGLGQGEETARTLVEVSLPPRMAASIWNRREASQDARQCSTTDGITAKALAALWDARPVIAIKGMLLSTPATEFGTHWGLGDLVTAELDTVAQDSIVESVALSVENGVEQITGTARSVE